MDLFVVLNLPSALFLGVCNYFMLLMLGHLDWEEELIIKTGFDELGTFD